MTEQNPSSRKLPPCYDGGRHRWERRNTRRDADSYEGPEDWCQRCGSWKYLLRFGIKGDNYWWLTV
jgi:hypothetical protein